MHDDLGSNRPAVPLELNWEDESGVGECATYAIGNVVKAGPYNTYAYHSLLLGRRSKLYSTSSIFASFTSHLLRVGNSKKSFFCSFRADI